MLAFTALEAVLLNTPGIEGLAATMLSGRWSWAIVMGAFMLASYVAQAWAQSSDSVSKQYAGLGLYVVAEAIIFVPILLVAQHYQDHVIAEAGILTLLLFGGMTAVAMLTKTDFSFLGGGLTIAGFAALGICICSAVFGFNLGLFFTGAMITLACGYILYYTSNVLHHYRIGQHVAAALALFASVALLFWYVLQLLMSLNSRD